MLRPQRAEAETERQDRVIGIGSGRIPRGALAHDRNRSSTGSTRSSQRADEPERRTRPVDVETVDALEELLISADIGVAATERIIAAIKTQVARRRQPARPGQAGDSRRLRGRRSPVDRGARRRRVTLVVGVNGTGKTTTVGKLANLLKTAGRRPLICAADTFRAAAVEQLEIWATPRRCRHGARARRRRSGGRRVRRDLVRESQGTRSDSGRHRRPAAHAREPDERAREDPADRGARSARAPRRKCCSCSTPPSGRTA